MLRSRTHTEQTPLCSSGLTMSPWNTAGKSGICLNWRGISGVPPSFRNRLIIFAKDARCVGQRTPDPSGRLRRWPRLLIAEYTSPSRWQKYTLLYISMTRYFNLQTLFVVWGVFINVSTRYSQCRHTLYIFLKYLKVVKSNQHNFCAFLDFMEFFYEESSIQVKY